jgi:serine/threonine-protein kinase RsbW
VSAGRPVLVLRVPSRTDFLATIRDVTRRVAEASGFDPAQSEQLALAVDEASTNVIEHAYRGSPGRTVEVSFDDRGRDLRVEVVDDGEAVDPRSVPEVDLRRYASERRTGGLGMHLMGRIMDSVTFRRRAGRNVCCMRKHKPTSQSRGEASS